MSQIHAFTLTTAGRTPAPLTRRAADVFPSNASPGVSLRMVFAHLRNWRLRRAERASLMALLQASDHILDDIGLGRHEVHEMVRKL